MEKLVFKKGTVLFSEGEVEHYMFDIRSGAVAIYSNYGKKGQNLITTVNSEGYVGEMGMIDGSPRSATAVAATDVQVSKVSYDNFNEYFELKPAKVLLILQNLSRRIRNLTKDYLDVCKVLDVYVEKKEVGEKIDQDLLAKMKEIAKLGKKD